MKDNGTIHTDPPKLAIIGCGAITETFYLPAFARFPEVVRNLVLVDTDFERARTIAQNFNISHYSRDYRELLNVVQGAIVAVPNHLHYAIAKDFLLGRAHVLCEKPLAETGAKVRDLISVATTSGVEISVNNTRRLMPSSAKVKELLEGGCIGEVLSLTYVDGNEFNWPTSSGFYFNAKLAQNGVLLDLGAHVFDLVCWWLGGTPRLIESRNDSFGGSEAVAEARLLYGKCRIEIRLSRLSRLSNQFRITGARGYIQGGVYDNRSVEVVEGVNGRRSTVIRLPDGSFSDLAFQLVSNFISVVQRKSRPLITAMDVLPSIELLEETYRSAERFTMPWYQPQRLLHES